MSRKTTSLYHPFFTEQERRDLELVPHDDLTGEIFLQRYLLVMVMSKSPPEPLDFDLLLEKTRACNTAIRSLISLIYAHLELRKGKKSESELFIEAAHLMAAEQLGIVDDAFPAETAEAIRSGNPYWIRYYETACPSGMEASFDTPGEQPLPAENSPLLRDTVPEALRSGKHPRRGQEEGPRVGRVSVTRTHLSPKRSGVGSPIPTHERRGEGKEREKPPVT